jgi:hypothetical protein
MSELTAHRTLALREAVANDPDTATLAILHALCLKLFYRLGLDSCLEVDAKSVLFGSQVEGLGGMAYAAAIDTRHGAWSASCRRIRRPRSAARLPRRRRRRRTARCRGGVARHRAAPPAPRATSSRNNPQGFIASRHGATDETLPAGGSAGAGTVAGLARGHLRPMRCHQSDTTSAPGFLGAFLLPARRHVLNDERPKPESLPTARPHVGPTAGLLKNLPNGYGEG